MPGDGLQPGDVVAGKYRVEARLGAGGMGYVLGAVHLAVGERVAIKVLHPESATHKENVERFLREARAVARIKGDHVVRLLDVGALADNTPYLVMEYLEGCDLSALIDARGPLPIPVAIDYVVQACEALAEAHAIGIVHRDVKPSNLFLTQKVDGSHCIKILDFGISKAMALDTSQPDMGLTQTQAVLGSPQYMAPEQMRSARQVDPRTDIWAIGAILHELLTGSAPFVSNALPELFAMILTDPTPSLRAKRPDVPEALDRVVMRCLEKRPDARYPSMDALARELAPFGSPQSLASIERISRVAANAAMRMTPAKPLDRPSASAPFAAAQTITDERRRPVAKIVAIAMTGLVVAAGASGAVLFALSSRAKHAAATEPSASPPPSATTIEDVVTSTTAEASAAPLEEPPPSASSSAAPSPSPSSRPATTRRTPPRVPAPVQPASATSARPAPPPTPPTTRPATTASSRYD